MRQRDGHRKRKREKKEVGKKGRRKRRVIKLFFIRGERSERIFYKYMRYVEELWCSANLLSTVAPHHFVDPIAEPNGEGFWLFGSTK